MSQASGPPAKVLPSSASAEAQGLEELKVAMEQIVLPLQQPVDLMVGGVQDQHEFCQSLATVWYV